MTNTPKTLLINLISDEGPNAGKALRLGRKFLAAEWQVVLLLNIDAVNLLNSDSSGLLCPAAGKTIIHLLKRFQAEGGRVLVGAECLNLNGLDEEHLLEGMEIAKFPIMEEILSRPHVRTMTW